MQKVSISPRARIIKVISTLIFNLLTPILIIKVKRIQIIIVLRIERLFERKSVNWKMLTCTGYKTIAKMIRRATLTS